MGHSNLIFVVGVGLIIAGLTFGAATNMRRNAEGPEIASEYRMSREIAITGLDLAKARLADDFYRWFDGDSFSGAYQGGAYSATTAFMDTGLVQVRSTGTYERGEYLVVAEYVWTLQDYDFGWKEKVTICHVMPGGCNNLNETISIAWSGWDSTGTGNKHGPINHSKICPHPVTGLDSLYADHIGPCGLEPWQNVTGVTLLQYSEWRIMN
jgi:hypothetical protein